MVPSLLLQYPQVRWITTFLYLKFELRSIQCVQNVGATLPLQNVGTTQPLQNVGVAPPLQSVASYASPKRWYSLTFLKCRCNSALQNVGIALPLYNAIAISPFQKWRCSFASFQKWWCSFASFQNIGATLLLSTILAFHLQARC